MYVNNILRTYLHQGSCFFFDRCTGQRVSGAGRNHKVTKVYRSTMTQGSRGAYILYIYTQQGVNIHKVYSRFVSQQLYTYAHGKVAKIKYIYRINWRIRYVSYSDIAYLTGHSILSIRAILSYTRGQTLPASGSHVTYRISSPNMI